MSPNIAMKKPIIQFRHTVKEFQVFPPTLIILYNITHLLTQWNESKYCYEKTNNSI